MFTGIVEQVGVIASIIRSSHSAKLAIAANKLLDDVRIGDKRRGHGVCLNRDGGPPHFAEFDLSRGNLEQFDICPARSAKRSNLEKALPVAAAWAATCDRPHRRPGRDQE